MIWNKALKSTWPQNLFGSERPSSIYEPNQTTYQNHSSYLSINHKPKYKLDLEMEWFYLDELNQGPLKQMDGIAVN